MKRVLIPSFLAMILLSACATNQGPEYNGRTYNQIKTYLTGEVVEEKPVVVSDNGSGLFLGALIGGVIGSTMGRGAGNTLATLGGGLAGAYAGDEIGKANGDELTVKLDSGEYIVVVVKGKQFMVGDRVKIIKDGNKVAQVDRIAPKPY
jgi:outer membrane lipoprotein SlyB